MGKDYCDYCDVFLTHDSASVRRAHNAGRNHLTNVRDYYASLGHDQAQDMIDQIVKMYENGPPPNRPMPNAPSSLASLMSQPPPMRFGPGPGAPPGMGGMGGGPPPGMGGPPQNFTPGGPPLHFGGGGGGGGFGGPPQGPPQGGPPPGMLQPPPGFRPPPGLPAPPPGFFGPPGGATASAGPQGPPPPRPSGGGAKLINGMSEDRARMLGLI
ncbi:zf-U1-domain-containing protein [Meredithblackwellia eburnea MCA 4105]